MRRLAIAILLLASPALGVETGLLAGSSCANVTGEGAVAWSVTASSYCTSSDNLRATVALSGSNTTSQRIDVAFDLSSIPDGSDVSGIELEIERSESSMNCVDLEIRLVLPAGTEGTDDKASGTGWTSSVPEDVVSYVGSPGTELEFAL